METPRTICIVSPIMKKSACKILTSVTLSLDGCVPSYAETHRRSFELNEVEEETELRKNSKYVI